ncbi:hypothetical protein [Wenyingzhuangia marina]|uniref:Uncharacterized protein n=1 Tax=Wenyingzhuangia marina TaxID=1195760 RepID=A0A1M5WQA3_9FLAO|nr:hypothetical protein [Wenyingzhuangia marina]GGF79719.1 hypothetical protein GCM10011397_23440 [Wenyingzhuangia marina]SHH89324.1 hypothetical protein SAMN05444281_2553 [Wenyingzhuangia marina]
MRGLLIIFFTFLYQFNIEFCESKIQELPPNKGEIKSDSIQIKYWDANKVFEYKFSIVNDSIYNHSLKEKSTLINKIKVEKIKKYINMFFESKNKQIELDRIKNKGFLDIGTYSELKILFFVNGCIVQKEVVILGSDTHKIIYSSEFMNFLKIIRNLCESIDSKHL